MRAITPTKTSELARRGGSEPSLFARLFRLAMRQRGPFLNLAAISPNWLLLLILVINIGLWVLMFMVAGNVHSSLCHLNEAQPMWFGKLICR